MNFSERELWLLRSAINGECIKLLKKRKVAEIEEYEAIENKLGIGLKNAKL